MDLLNITSGNVDISLLAFVAGILCAHMIFAGFSSRF